MGEARGRSIAVFRGPGVQWRDLENNPHDATDIAA